MNYSKQSISIAMKKLKERHYIIIDDNGYITLTEMGLTVAKSVLEKHEIISSVLIKLGVNEDIAYKDACRIEHIISPETFADNVRLLYPGNLVTDLKVAAFPFAYSAYWRS